MRAPDFSGTWTLAVRAYGIRAEVFSGFEKHWMRI